MSLGVGHHHCSWQEFTFPEQDTPLWREAHALKLTETWEAYSSVRRRSQPPLGPWIQSGLLPELSDLEKPGVLVEKH